MHDTEVSKVKSLGFIHSCKLATCGAFADASQSWYETPVKKASVRRRLLAPEANKHLYHAWVCECGDVSE